MTPTEARRRMDPNVPDPQDVVLYVTRGWFLFYAFALTLFVLTAFGFGILLAMRFLTCPIT